VADEAKAPEQADPLLEEFRADAVRALDDGLSRPWLWSQAERHAVEALRRGVMGADADALRKLAGYGEAGKGA
jgi:hypothetical protein